MTDMNLKPAEGWRPESGDVLVGVVQRVEPAWSDFIGGYYPLVVITPESGGDDIAVHCFHDVLRKRMLTLKPKTGERIGIKFHGQQQHKTDNRRTVANYTVKIEGRDTDADAWGAMSPIGPAQPSQAPDASDHAPRNDGAQGEEDLPF